MEATRKIVSTSLIRLVISILPLHRSDADKALVAKLFDPSEREDVPWPVDPIFGTANAQGVGVWVTTNADLDTS
jgi:hypothetical protein